MQGGRRAIGNGTDVTFLRVNWHGGRGNDDLYDHTQAKGGFHNWETKAFLLGWRRTADGAEVDKKNSVLHHEFQKRNRKGTAMVNEITGRPPRPFVYREYYSTFDIGKNEQRKITQGVPRTMHAAVTLGMCEYMLQRSIKYGNVCRDCALTLAQHGLYRRAGTAVVNAGAVEGPKGMKGVDAWWYQFAIDDNFKRRQVVHNGVRKALDPWFLYAMVGGAKPPVGDAIYRNAKGEFELIQKGRPSNRREGC